MSALLPDESPMAINRGPDSLRITLSDRIPVAGKEITFTLRGGDPTGQAVDFCITGNGGQIYAAAVSSSGDRAVASWLPEETGFYRVTFQSSSLGMVSLEFPVVWRDMHFIAWPPPERSDADKYRYLPQYIVLTGRPGEGGVDDVPFWKENGCRTLSYVFLPRGKVDMERAENEVIDELVAQWSAPLQQGFDGIFIDEFGMYPKAESRVIFNRAAKALVKLRQQQPEMVIFPANAGALLAEQAIVYNDAGAMALLETYPTCYTRSFATHDVRAYIDRNVDVARNTDLTFYEANPRHGAIILLGLNGLTSFIEEPYVPQLEDLVRYIKKTAAEMPGIGFYTSGSVREHLADSGQLAVADRLCHDYYIKPVVDLRAIYFSCYAPAAGVPLDVLLEVHNLGGMDARDVKVALYARKAGGEDKALIGEMTIEKIGCGHRSLQKQSADKPYEFQSVNGNTYAVYEKVNKVFLARTTRKLAWTPAEKGYYSITAEVEPSDRYTVLDGVLEKHLGVR